MSPFFKKEKPTQEIIETPNYKIVFYQITRKVPSHFYYEDNLNQKERFSLKINENIWKFLCKKEYIDKDHRTEEMNVSGLQDFDNKLKKVWDIYKEEYNKKIEKEEEIKEDSEKEKGTLWDTEEKDEKTKKEKDRFVKWWDYFTKYSKKILTDIAVYIKDNEKMDTRTKTHLITNCYEICDGESGVGTQYFFRIEK